MVLSQARGLLTEVDYSIHGMKCYFASPAGRRRNMPTLICLEYNGLNEPVVFHLVLWSLEFLSMEPL
jgi:hypothetical protein